MRVILGGSGVLNSDMFLAALGGGAVGGAAGSAGGLGATRADDDEQQRQQRRQQLPSLRRRLPFLRGPRPGPPRLLLSSA